MLEQLSSSSQVALQLMTIFIPDSFFFCLVYKISPQKMVYVLPKAQEGILKCHVLSTTKKNIQFTDIVEETSQETRK